MPRDTSLALALVVSFLVSIVFAVLVAVVDGPDAGAVDTAPTHRQAAVTTR